MKPDIPEFWHLGSHKYPAYKIQLQTLFLLCVRKSFFILECGCGSDGGYLTKTKNITGVGLDISRANIEKSLKISKKFEKNNQSFVVGDMEKMPFREDVFDLIISQDVFEHIKDKEKAVSEIAFSLKEKGKILLSTTNAFNPSMFIDEILPKNISETIIRLLGGPQYYERSRRLNPWNLNKILASHGIRLKKLLLTGIPPFGAPWLYVDYPNLQLPMIFYPWILFDCLTNIRSFQKFKEVMIVVAEKETVLQTCK